MSESQMMTINFSVLGGLLLIVGWFVRTIIVKVYQNERDIAKEKVTRESEIGTERAARETAISTIKENYIDRIELLTTLIYANNVAMLKEVSAVRETVIRIEARCNALNCVGELK
jgi:hypothetical protein